MAKISKVRLNEVAQTVASQLDVIQALRYEVTEHQADSVNHLEQEALQAELDRISAIAANLNRALADLAA